MHGNQYHDNQQQEGGRKYNQPQFQQQQYPPTTGMHGNQYHDNQQQEGGRKIPSLLDNQHQGTPPNVFPGNHVRPGMMRPMMRPQGIHPRPNFHPNMRPQRGVRPHMMGEEYYHDDGARVRGPRPGMRGFGPQRGGPRMMGRPPMGMMNRHPVSKQPGPHNDQGNYNDQGMPIKDQKLSRFDQMPSQFNEPDLHGNRPPFQPRNQAAHQRHPQHPGGFRPRTPQNLQRFDQPPQQPSGLHGNQHPGLHSETAFWDTNNIPQQQMQSNNIQLNQPQIQNQQQIQPINSQNSFPQTNQNLKIISPNDNAPSSLDKPPGLSPSPVVVNSDQPPPPGDDNVQLPINVIGSSNMSNQPHNVNERNVGMGEIPNDAPMKTPKKKKKKKHRKRKHSSTSNEDEDIMEKIRQIEKMVKKKEDIEDGEVKSGSDDDPALKMLNQLKSQIKPKKKKKKHKKDKKRSKKARKDYKSSSSDSDGERRKSISRSDQYQRSHRDNYGHDKRDTDARYDSKYMNDRRSREPNIDEADDMQLLAMSKKFNKRTRSKDFHGEQRPGLLSTPPEGYRKNRQFEDEPIPTNKKRKVVVKENKKINDWNRHKDDNDLVHFYSDEEDKYRKNLQPRGSMDNRYRRNSPPRSSDWDNRGPHQPQAGSIPVLQPGNTQQIPILQQPGYYPPHHGNAPPRYPPAGFYQGAPPFQGRPPQGGPPRGPSGRLLEPPNRRSFDQRGRF